jgi:NADH dehydrogenase
MKKRTICVLGGTGFVGRHLVTQLAADGHRLRVPTRHRERHRALLVLPTVEVIDADIHDPAVLADLIQGCDVVINLVAVLNEDRRARFQDVHVELPRRIAETCRLAGVRRLLHMSALNADAKQGASRYLKSKGEGEDLVHAAAGEHFHVTSFRPSVIFGPDDHLFNRFAALLKRTPILPVPCPEARVAPVYVADVVQAMVTAMDDKRCYGQRYELCGPHSYSMLDLMHYTARVLGLKRTIIGLSDALSRLQARVMQSLPGRAFTVDNYRSLQVDGICRGDFPELFGIVPTAIEGVVPYYLGRRDQQALFAAIRVQSRHEY